MRYVCLFLLGLLSGGVRAQQADDFRLIQAMADLPTITIWANLPDTDIDKEQFSVQVGPYPAKVFGIDSFHETGEGVGYIFLVDVSRNLRSRQLVQIKRTLHHWLDGMAKKDRAALITFGHDTQHELAFTDNYFKLQNVGRLSYLATVSIIVRWLYRWMMFSDKSKNIECRFIALLMSQSR